MTIASPDERPDEAVLDFLRSAFEPGRREPALGYEAVSTWEAENGAVLPEPYRSLVAEISNGSSVGPPEDGGLLPLGWLTPGWPHWGDRDPAAPFPLLETWAWEGEPLAADHDERVADVYGHGSVVLGADDELCYWLLVVNGPTGAGSGWSARRAPTRIRAGSLRLLGVGSTPASRRRLVRPTATGSPTRRHAAASRTACRQLCASWPAPRIQELAVVAPNLTLPASGGREVRRGHTRFRDPTRPGPGTVSRTGGRRRALTVSTGPG